MKGRSLAPTRASPRTAHHHPRIRPSLLPRFSFPSLSLMCGPDDDASSDAIAFNHLARIRHGFDPNPPDFDGDCCSRARPLIALDVRTLSPPETLTPRRQAAQERARRSAACRR